MSNNPFNILSSESAPPKGGHPVKEESKDGSIESRIQKLIQSSEVFLFMKGVPDMPQCGFSANTVAILNSMGLDFRTFDILTDQDIREGVKKFSNWPTFPQLYIKERLIGGNDIVTELYQSGDLESTIKESLES